MARKHGTSVEFDFCGAALFKHWKVLHQGDREPWPHDERVQGAWRAFHQGDFPGAVKQGSALEAMGAVVANKAAAVQTLYTAAGTAKVLEILRAAIDRGERAVKELPERANAHYTMALVLGRYSQRISILKALAQGLAGRVRSLLERALELEPRHAEAHVALGLYHAEIINKLGSLAAGLTYGASADTAMEHFDRASHLAPSSPIVQLEHAHGLILLDAVRHRPEAQRLFERAATSVPCDAMAAQDVEYAKRELAEAKSSRH